MEYTTPNGTVTLHIDANTQLFDDYCDKAPMSNDDFVMELLPSINCNVNVIRDIINDIEYNSGNDLDPFTKLMLGIINDMACDIAIITNRQHLTAKHMEKDE